MDAQDARPLVDDANGAPVEPCPPTDPLVPRPVYERVRAELDAVRAIATGDGCVKVPDAGLVRDVYQLRRRAMAAERRAEDAERKLTRRPVDAAGCVQRAATLLDDAIAHGAGGQLAVAELVIQVADRWITLALAAQMPPVDRS